MKYMKLTVITSTLILICVFITACTSNTDGDVAANDKADYMPDTPYVSDVSYVPTEHLPTNFDALYANGELCPLCGDHFIGEDLRTPTPPLFIREWHEVDEEFWNNMDGRIGLTYIEHSGDMDNPIAQIEQWWGASQLDYNTMLIWSEEELRDVRVVALGFNDFGDEMSFFVRHELLTIGWLSPNSMIMVNAGLFHYLIPRMGITFTDASGNHNRMLIHESMRGGCYPLFNLGIFDENHFALWDDSSKPLPFVKRDMNTFEVHGLGGRIFVNQNMHDIYLGISDDIDIVGLQGESIEGVARITQDSMQIYFAVARNEIIIEHTDGPLGTLAGPSVEFEYMSGMGLVDGITFHPFEFYNSAHPPLNFELSEEDAVQFAHILLKAVELVAEYRAQ